VVQLFGLAVATWRCHRRRHRRRHLGVAIAIPIPIAMPSPPPSLDLRQLNGYLFMSRQEYGNNMS
jgi:hypothetical protein